MTTNSDLYKKFSKYKIYGPFDEYSIKRLTEESREQLYKRFSKIIDLGDLGYDLNLNKEQLLGLIFDIECFEKAPYLNTLGNRASPDMKRIPGGYYKEAMFNYIKENTGISIPHSSSLPRRYYKAIANKLEL